MKNNENVTYRTFAVVNSHHMHIVDTQCYCGQSVKLLNKSSAVAEMGDGGHNRHGPKRGGCCAPFAGAGTPSSTMWPGPRSTSVPSGVFNSFIQPYLVTIDMGQKLSGGGCALFLG